MRIALGIIARRGLSLRNGYWDADAGTPLGSSPEFVSDDQNAMTDFTYMADAMGNIRGLIDSATDTAKLQTFDAFGNNIGGYITLRAASDCNYQDTYKAHCGLPIDPPNPAERMQAGSYSWRGGEGSQTDLLADDLLSGDRIPDPRTKNPDDTCCDHGNNVVAHERTMVSTGLVYMVNRFYEPETGRFTQPDLLDYDPLQLIGGQNNRWMYAANDPINLSDPTGLCLDLGVISLAFIALLILLLLELLFASIAWLSYGVVYGLFSLGTWLTNLLSDAQLGAFNLLIGGGLFFLGVGILIAAAGPVGVPLAILLLLAGIAHVVVGLLLTDASKEMGTRRHERHFSPGFELPVYAIHYRSNRLSRPLIPNSLRCSLC